MKSGLALGYGQEMVEMSTGPGLKGLFAVLEVETRVWLGNEINLPRAWKGSWLDWVWNLRSG